MPYVYMTHCEQVAAGISVAVNIIGAYIVRVYQMFRSHDAQYEKGLFAMCKHQRVR